MTPITPEEQKTILLRFDSVKECRSIREQVSEQVKAARSVFYLKTIECVSCEQLYGAKSPHCPAVVAKKLPGPSK